MQQILITLLSLGAAQALILALVMWHKQQPFLVIWLALFAIEISNKVLLAANIAPSFSQWLGYWFSFDLAYGPLLLLWVLKLIHPQSLSKWHLLHFVPLVLFTLINLSQLLPLDNSTRIAYIQAFATTVQPSVPPENLWHVIMQLLLFHPLVYALISIGVLWQHRVRFAKESSGALEVRFDWLLWLVCLQVIMWLALFALAAWVTLPALQQLLLSYVPAVIWLNAAASLSLAYAQLIIAHRPVTATTIEQPEQSEIPSTIASEQSQSTDKYQTSSLADESVKQIAAQLDAAMAQGLFKQSKLSLTDVAEQLALPSHWVSQVINQHFDCNFFDFVNRYRIAQIKQDLHTLEHSILDIAFANGFNSKSTFNAVFKKHVEMTPSEFRRAGCG